MTVSHIGGVITTLQHEEFPTFHLFDYFHNKTEVMSFLEEPNGILLFILHHMGCI